MNGLQCNEFKWSDQKSRDFSPLTATIKVKVMKTYLSLLKCSKMDLSKKYLSRKWTSFPEEPGRLIITLFSVSYLTEQIIAQVQNMQVKIRVNNKQSLNKILSSHVCFVGHQKLQALSANTTFNVFLLFAISSVLFFSQLGFTCWLLSSFVYLRGRLCILLLLIFFI